MTSAGLTAQAVADLVGGRLLGDGGVVVSAVGPIDRAGPGALTMAVSPRYAHALAASSASAALVPPALAEAAADEVGDRLRGKASSRHATSCLL